MWFATVVGLCMGGGQLLLGSVLAIMGFLVLWGFRYLERHVEPYQLAEVKITVGSNQLRSEELRQRLEAADFWIKSFSFTNCLLEQKRKFNCEVHWPSHRGSAAVPELIAEIEHLPGVIELEWKAASTGPQ
jgi:putative Mg2+ transporter-C (MgtC) family protein